MFGLADIPVANTRCFGLSAILLAIALDDDSPFLLSVVPSRRVWPWWRSSNSNSMTLVYDLQPVADLVLGRKYWPVLREVDVWQVIVPDRIVQAERLVAVTPGIAGTIVLLNDDGGHAELAQPRSERDTALAAANDEHIGLGLDAELLGFLVAQFLPGFGSGMTPCRAPSDRVKPAFSS